MLLPYFVKNLREVKFGRYFNAWVKIYTTPSRENLHPKSGKFTTVKQRPPMQNIMVRNEVEGSESVDGGSNPYTKNQNLINQKSYHTHQNWGVG